MFDVCIYIIYNLIPSRTQILNSFALIKNVDSMLINENKDYRNTGSSHWNNTPTRIKHRSISPETADIIDFNDADIFFFTLYSHFTSSF